MRRSFLAPSLCVLALLSGIEGCRAKSSAPDAAAATASSAEARGDEVVAHPPPEKSPIKRLRKRPSGGPPRLSCAAARSLVADVHAKLAAKVSLGGAEQDAKVDGPFADSILDWADPHGLWTASPDTPVAPLVRAHTAKLRAVLEGKGDCEKELAPIGESLAGWMTTLRTEWVAGAADAAAIDVPVAASDAAFDDGPVKTPAKKLARVLAQRAAAVQKGHPELAGVVSSARDRWLPVLSKEAWGEVVLSAAVRAYIPLLDPHGAWAPAEESSSLYDRDLEIAPPGRLWTTATRTALGTRIETGAHKPLLDKDVVVSVDGLPLAGLSAEAIDQLSESPDGTAEPRSVRVLRKTKDGGLGLVELSVASALADEAAAPAGLHTALVPYGATSALVIRLDDVPDALGEELARAIGKARGEAEISGIVLDLRGNGGGSIDGASGALGVFLPGAPLFPLKHRDGTIETERATEPPMEDRWTGPVVALVDGGTASAAEMIAGALKAYRRGLVVGARTYGKGCAQEYVDDVTGVGVLRMTTLLFALPDGTPVQRVGIEPSVTWALPSPLKEREADLPRSPPTWIGPDVRDHKRVSEVPWATVANVGPCSDEVVCRALALVGKGKAIAKR
ncbi:MAG: hypothetical protein JNL79_23605 [Myxococcales bacterium]|nr:hypothetical protein [Myxococcales bacterium]